MASNQETLEQVTPENLLTAAEYDEDETVSETSESRKTRCLCCKVDKRITNVLVNPRFHGIPHAFALTAAILSVLLLSCFGLGWYLSILNQKELCVAETVFSTNDLSTCEEIQYTEQIGYRFNSSALELGSKAYLSVEIDDVERFKTYVETSAAARGEGILSDDAVSYVNDFCFEKVSETPSCLEDDPSSPATKLPADRLLNSTYSITRVVGDELYSIELDGGSAPASMVYYHSQLGTDAFYTAIITFGETSDPIAVFDVTLFPVFVPSAVLGFDSFNTASADFIKTMGTNAGRVDLFGISLKTRFAKCCKQTGLSAFEYFGLLCDYAFLLEGILALFCTFVIIGIFKVTSGSKGSK